MNQDVQSKPIKTDLPMRRVVSTVVLMVVAFLIGFLPMWWKSREGSENLSRAERQLSLAKLQNALASAVIDARRGDYEPARKAASDFFTSLRVETERGDDSALTPAQIERIFPLFSRRDEIITLLARNDSASGERLAELYVSYRKGVEKK